jgi:hypothetical protein
MTINCKSESAADWTGRYSTNDNLRSLALRTAKARKPSLWARFLAFFA